MPRLTLAAVLLAALTLTACGGGTTVTPPDAPEQIADDTDDGALTLASTTFNLTPTQTAHALGLNPQAIAPTAPVTVTVAVKVGKAGSKYAGQKRAYVGWKLNGKTFPADLTGKTSGTYSLALNDGSGALLGRSRTGTVAVTLPLPSGNLNTSRSRSTGYVQNTTGACAVATFALTLPTGTTLNNGAAPITVCEPGTTPPVTSTPAPAPTLADAYVVPWFGDAHGTLNHFVGLYRVPTGAQVAASWRVRGAEECGSQGDPVDSGYSSYQQTTDPDDASRPVFRAEVADHVQDFDRGAGVEWEVMLALDGQTRTLSGLSCYSSTPQLQ